MAHEVNVTVLEAFRRWIWVQFSCQQRNLSYGFKVIFFLQVLKGGFCIRYTFVVSLNILLSAHVRFSVSDEACER